MSDQEKLTDKVKGIRFHVRLTRYWAYDIPGGTQWKGEDYTVMLPKETGKEQGIE